MHKPIMINRILFITFLFIFLVLPHHADARLTLGAVTDKTGRSITTERTEALAARISEKLDEEVTIKWMADTDALLNWLDRFAAVDLALLPEEVIKNNRGRFLVIGSLDEESSVSLVARQGVPGDVPKQLGELVRLQRGSQWRTEEPAPQAKPVPADEPSSTVLESLPGAVEHIPAEQTGPAWEPGEAVQLPEIVTDKALETKKLVLGVAPDPTGLISAGQQAEAFAAALEVALPVTVTVREFARMETFTEWFMRYRMVDIAVVSPEVAMLNLGRDYMPVAKLYRSDKPGAESAELVVMRRDANDQLQNQVQQALLGMAETPDGQERLARLQISEVFIPGHDRVVSAPQPQEIVPTPDIQKLTDFEGAEEEKTPELPDPFKPEAPVVVPVPQPPLVADIEGPAPAPGLPELPEAVDLPEPGVDEAIQPDFEQAEEDIADALPEDFVPEQPSSPPQPGFVPPPVLATPEAKPSTPVVMPTPELPELPETVTPSNAPVAPGDVAPVDLPSASSPLEVAALPQMPDKPVMPEKSQPPLVTEAVPAPEPETVKVSPEEPFVEESVVGERSIVEEVMQFAEPVSSHELQGKMFVLPDGDDEGDVTETQDLIAMLGEDPVAPMVAQPNLPQELRPSGIPVVRPGRVKPSTEVDEELLVASLPESIPQVEPSRPPVLLPEPEPEPGIVYVVPFVSVMVPQEVSAGIFDQFVDLLIQEGDDLGLEFLILKEGLQRVAPEWLAVRKYVTGEIFAYVEDRGATSTDLRSKARLTFRHPNQDSAALNFEYPVRFFFNHDNSTLEVERTKMAKNIAETLAKELIETLQN